jgi:small subunit ribosomal protein S14
MKYLIEKDKKRRNLYSRYEKKRILLKALYRNQHLPQSVRWRISMRLAELPRNSAPSRIRNRCVISGRPRAVHKHFKVSPTALRNLVSYGFAPGMTKSSW